MRMYYLPEEIDEFAAGTELLVQRCRRWARDDGSIAAPDAPSWALEFRHNGVDGRLGRWTGQLVRDFLLDWVPRRVSARPADLVDVPESLRTLLRYLDRTGLLDPTGETLTELEPAIRSTAGEFERALADESRFGLAKFWTMRAMAAGVDPTDRMAMERFTAEADVDQDTLDRIIARHLQDGGGLGERMPPQLPVHLPSGAELAAAVAKSPLPHQVGTLVAWVGTAGRRLTDKGALKLADARELVGLLGTDDQFDPVIGDQTFRTKSSSELAGLMLVVELAKKIRLLRVRDNRLVRVAKNQRLLEDQEALWNRLFATVLEEPDVVLPTNRYLGDGILAFEYAEHMVDICNTIYGLPEPMPVVRLAEPIWQHALEVYTIEDAEPHLRDLWRKKIEWDLLRALRCLQDLGAVEQSTGIPDALYRADLVDDPAGPRTPLPGEARQRLLAALAPGAEPVDLVRLTPLGTHAVRTRLLAEGRAAPLVGELVGVPPEQLLGTVAEHYPLDTGSEEIALWLDVHGGEHIGTPLLLEAIGRCPFRSRAAAMLGVLAEGRPDRTTWLRTLRGHPTVGPLATISLVNDEVLGIDDLTDVERTQAFTEQLLQLLEVGGPQAVRESLASVPADDRKAMLVDITHSGHPDARGVAELRDVIEHLRSPGTAHPLGGVSRRGRDRRKPRNRRR